MYLIKTNHSFNSPKCNQCDSNLILVKEVVEMLPDFLTPITTTIYRCSDLKCQKNIEKKTSERLQSQVDQEVAKQRRIKNKAEFRKISLNKI